MSTPPRNSERLEKVLQVSGQLFARQGYHGTSTREIARMADVWAYIMRENIPIVPLYFSKPRPCVRRNGQLLMVDDDRFPLQNGEQPEMISVRFRTLGCYPLTAAVESTATTLEDIVNETLAARTSERQGRLIDHDQAASMEKKKQEGYF